MNKKALILASLLTAILCLPAGMLIGINHNSDTEGSEFVILAMDAWNEHPYKPDDVADPDDKAIIQGYNEWFDSDVLPNLRDKLVPMLDFARQNDIAVVFSQNGYPLSTELDTLEFGEPIINHTEDLDAYLRGRGITTIMYTGYATNVCILGRPTGIRAMSELGYNIVLIKDCSVPLPGYDLTYEEALDEIEQLGSITTSDEVRRLLQ